jgi:hypothetical protein
MPANALPDFQSRRPSILAVKRKTHRAFDSPPDSHTGTALEACSKAMDRRRSHGSRASRLRHEVQHFADESFRRLFLRYVTAALENNQPRSGEHRVQSYSGFQWDLTVIGSPDD